MFGKKFISIWASSRFDEWAGGVQEFQRFAVETWKTLGKKTCGKFGARSNPGFSMNIFNVGTPKDETVRVGRLSRLKQLVFVGYVPVASKSIYFRKINDSCIVTG